MGDLKLMSDLRLIADFMLANLLLRILRLIVTKTFLEPFAVWAGRKGYKWVDKLAGGKLPDLPE